MKKLIKSGFVCAWLASQAASGANPTPSPPAPATGTVQERFDAGGAALAAREWQKAFDIYADLEQFFLASNPKARSLPIVRLRKARSMGGLGQEEAEAAIVNALDTLPDDPSLLEDRYLSLMMAGALAEDRFDYPQAVERWRSAAGLAQDAVMGLNALLMAIPLAIFVDAEAALRDADKAQALVDSNPGLDKKWVGLIRNYRGRTLLNMGNYKAARAELDASVKLLGGLSYGKVDRLDTSVRSDAAIAALLDKDPERARELLTYAGASVAAKQGFSRARDMNPPSCGIDGLKPEDVAVVEFMVRSDGSVAAARPIYFSGNLALAAEFARAVGQWSWSQEQLKRLSPFFRSQARIELRCTQTFKRPPMEDLLLPSVFTWLEGKGIAPSVVPKNSSEAVRFAALKVELLERKSAAGENDPALLGTLAEMARSRATSTEAGKPYAKRAYEIARDSGAQGEALAWFMLRYWSYDDRRWNSRPGDRYQRQLAQALADPAILVEPRAEAAVRIAMFDSLGAAGRRKGGRQIIEPLIASERFDAAHEFRAGAYLRLANIEQADGNLQAARTYFEKSGISSQQCSLVDAKPALAKGPGPNPNFPREILRWGLSGWNMVELDISAEGVPQNIRTIAAFPPFVFAADAEKKSSTMRYQQTYRPDNQQGCVGNQFGVVYK